MAFGVKMKGCHRTPVPLSGSHGTPPAAAKAQQRSGGGGGGASGEVLPHDGLGEVAPGGARVEAEGDRRVGPRGGRQAPPRPDRLLQEPPHVPRLVEPAGGDGRSGRWDTIQTCIRRKKIFTFDSRSSFRIQSAL